MSEYNSLLDKLIQKNRVKTDPEELRKIEDVSIQEQSKECVTLKDWMNRLHHGIKPILQGTKLPSIYSKSIEAAIRSLETGLLTSIISSILSIASDFPETYSKIIDWMCLKGSKIFMHHKVFDDISIGELMSRSSGEVVAIIKIKLKGKIEETINVFTDLEQALSRHDVHITKLEELITTLETSAKGDDEIAETLNLNNRDSIIEAVLEAVRELDKNDILQMIILDAIESFKNTHSICILSVLEGPRGEYVKFLKSKHDNKYDNKY